MLYAAVVVPIVRYEDPALVVVRRAAHLRRNPGEIAFPGGIVDAADADARAAALREFQEELGVALDRVRIVERLDDVVTLARTVTVAPYVGLLDPPVPFRHDASETAGVYEIPLAALYASGAVHRGVERVTNDGATYDVPTWLFDYGDLHVWGATARMIAALLVRYPTLEAARAIGATIGR
ncbi:MAG: hypothetical protein NVSMB21_19060 [Vulcanimicrobiaceae bacterium]